MCCNSKRRQYRDNSHQLIHKHAGSHTHTHVSHNLSMNHVYLAWHAWNLTSSKERIRTRNGQNNRNVEIKLIHPHRCENRSRGGGDLRLARSLFGWREQQGFTSTHHHKTLWDRDITFTFCTFSKQSHPQQRTQHAAEDGGSGGEAEKVINV